MRLVSYNILDGGEGRADPLAEIILAQQCDIAVLVEADSADVLDRIAKRLEMDVVHAKGRRHFAAVLTRWEMVESINHAPLHPELSDCLLEATIADPSGQAWTVAAIHLHPHATEADEREREREISTVLRVFEPHRKQGRRHLLCGDFNSNSPIQEIDPEKVKPRTKQEWEANGGEIPRRVVTRIQADGYADSLYLARGPEAGRIGTFSTQYPGQRVDYIFTYGVERRQIKEAWVEQDRLAKYSSDHFPVGIELAS